MPYQGISAVVGNNHRARHEVEEMADHSPHSSARNHRWNEYAPGHGAADHDLDVVCIGKKRKEDKRAVES